MEFKNLPAGTYKARIQDWGLEEVAKLNGRLKAVIMLDIFFVEPDGSGGDIVSARWEGFLETKEGNPNMKTMKALITCGFKSDDLMDLSKPDALDNTRDYECTVGRDGDYNRVTWINRPGEGMAGAGIRKVQPKKKLSAAFTAALAKARQEAGVTAAAEDEVGF